IQIPNPPITASLGATSVSVRGESCAAELSARVFDFGVVSLRARVSLPRDLSWEEFVAWGPMVASVVGSGDVFRTARQTLRDRIAAAVAKLGDSPVTEDYVVFRIDRVTDSKRDRLPAVALRDEDISQLLTGEARPLSATARRDLLSQRFTYFEDD